ncbi:MULTISPECIES: hypothetical protein [Nocardiopsis]|uniref:hypothetical protein n=1 Tax=Nocardiopsis TaxID=2013 RepID=UPI001D03ED91|nr:MULTISPECIES: hypothetical protein [Nocardiopsis]
MRRITPTAPSSRHTLALASVETTAIGLPPTWRASRMAALPSPPAPPQISTGSPGRTTLGSQPRSWR